MCTKCSQVRERTRGPENELPAAAQTPTHFHKVCYGHDSRVLLNRYHAFFSMLQEPTQDLRPSQPGRTITRRWVAYRWKAHTLHLLASLRFTTHRHVLGFHRTLPSLRSAWPRHCRRLRSTARYVLLLMCTFAYLGEILWRSDWGSVIVCEFS